MKLRNYDLRLTPDASRVVIRPFHIAPDKSQEDRVKRIVDTVMHLSPESARHELQVVDVDFDSRHWQTKGVYLHRYAQVMADLGLNPPLSDAHKELIGAYFCHEYSYAAAAVMNPSVVPHVDQTGLINKGDQKFILSLRTVGEGHISSIAFREGILTADGELSLWPQPSFSMSADSTETEPEGEVVAKRPKAVPISGMVMFPFTRAQRNGLEDLRLVRFEEENGSIIYYGAYTAYSGAGIRSELLETFDFTTFRLSPMEGDAPRNKGMALFPRRINGRFAMIGRQDGESLYFLESDDPRVWNGGERFLTPKLPWELVQIGNCGAPIELEEGWLLLTHGVGAMRKYSIGAVLLDKHDPRRVLGRLTEPLLSPSNENREGYVPNVLYTCGAMKHGDELFLPYGVADSSVSFAMVDLKSLLSELR
ncbi:glycoside hydrolase family 130 protein [Terricaulis sp.]|uniref:glycoside hydrolase family 130 protein n=1 Tax=Terricaulis sp. TaxID=2768686 RepID=UPI0037851B6A